MTIVGVQEFCSGYGYKMVNKAYSILRMIVPHVEKYIVSKVVKLIRSKYWIIGIVETLAKILTFQEGFKVLQ